MSTDEVIRSAHQRGLEKGIELGQKQGAVQAYLGMQKLAQEFLNNAAPYSDTRAAAALLDYANGKLLGLGSSGGTEAHDGS